MASTDRFLFICANDLFSNTNRCLAFANYQATNGSCAGAHANSRAGIDNGHRDNNNRRLSKSNLHEVKRGVHNTEDRAVKTLPRILSCNWPIRRPVLQQHLFSLTSS
jgi:hypothetical protein